MNKYTQQGTPLKQGSVVFGIYHYQTARITTVSQPGTSYRWPLELKEGLSTGKISHAQVYRQNRAAGYLTLTINSVRLLEYVPLTGRHGDTQTSKPLNNDC